MAFPFFGGAFFGGGFFQRLPVGSASAGPPGKARARNRPVRRQLEKPDTARLLREDDEIMALLAAFVATQD